MHCIGEGGVVLKPHNNVLFDVSPEILSKFLDFAALPDSPFCVWQCRVLTYDELAGAAVSQILSVSVQPPLVHINQLPRCLDNHTICPS